MDKISEIQNRLLRISASRANHVGRKEYLGDVRFLLNVVETMRDDLFMQHNIIRQLREGKNEEKEKGF